MKIKKQDVQTVRNLTFKHMLTTGTGTHADKSGDRASRSRQKRKWKKQVHKEMDVD